MKNDDMNPDFIVAFSISSPFLIPRLRITSIKIIPKAKTLKITQKITYSNVNKVNSIDLPEEVKNAKDKYDTKL